MQVRYQAALRPDRSGSETLRDAEGPRKSRAAPPRSILPAERGPPLLQPLGELLELGLDVVQHQLAVGLPESDLHLRRALLAQVEEGPAGARDGVAARVEQLDRKSVV